MNKLKTYFDAAANIVKAIEELDPEAKILDGIQRSLQMDFYSCGVQSAYVILRYHGKRCTIDKLEKELQTDWSGTAMEDIERVIRKYRLQYRIIKKAKLKDLRSAIDAGHPVLILTGDGSHWTVVYGYSSTHIFVCDPSLFENIWCRVPRSEFMEQWDKFGMVVKR